MTKRMQTHPRIGESWRALWPVLLAGAVAGGSGCSTLKRAAMNQVGDALAGGGTTFASDDDPEFIRLATPFSLKMMESLLEQNPRHPRLLLAASKGFTQYAYAFIQADADQLESEDFEASTHQRQRARAMFLRGRSYGLRALDQAHGGFSNALENDPRGAVMQAGEKDVPLLYWTACAWGGAISAAKNDPELIAGLPQVEALISRAFTLNPDYDHGAIHQFLIAFEGARTDVDGDPATRSRRHMERVLELSEGQLASPLVSFAESVCVKQQNRQEFEALLHRALSIDPDQRPEWRLLNLVMQRRARWLLASADELFLPIPRVE